MAHFKFSTLGVVWKIYKNSYKHIYQ